MSHSHMIHDVTKLTVKRQPDSDSHWTTLLVEHNDWGYDAAGEYVSIKNTTEITLHHSGTPKLPVKIENKRSGA